MHFMWNMKQNILRQFPDLFYFIFIACFHLYLKQLHKKLCILSVLLKHWQINHNNSSIVFVLFETWIDWINDLWTVLMVNLDILKSTLTCNACWDILTFYTKVNYKELWNRVTVTINCNCIPCGWRFLCK